MRLREENADSIGVFLYCPSAAIAFFEKKRRGKAPCGQSAVLRRALEGLAIVIRRGAVDLFEDTGVIIGVGKAAVLGEHG